MMRGLFFFMSFLLVACFVTIKASAQTPAAGHRYDYYQTSDGKLKCGLFSPRGNLVKPDEIQTNCPVKDPEWEVYTMGDGSTAVRCVIKSRSGVTVETVPYSDYMQTSKRCDEKILYYKWYHYTGDTLPRCGRWARLSHEQQYWVYEVRDRAHCEREAK